MRRAVILLTAVFATGCTPLVSSSRCHGGQSEGGNLVVGRADRLAARRRTEADLFPLFRRPATKADHISRGGSGLASSLNPDPATWRLASAGRRTRVYLAAVAGVRRGICIATFLDGTFKGESCAAANDRSDVYLWSRDVECGRGLLVATVPRRTNDVVVQVDRRRYRPRVRNQVIALYVPMRRYSSIVIRLHVRGVETARTTIN